MRIYGFVGISRPNSCNVQQGDLGGWVYDLCNAAIDHSSSTIQERGRTTPSLIEAGVQSIKTIVDGFLTWKTCPAHIRSYRGPR